MSTSARNSGMQLKKFKELIYSLSEMYFPQSYCRGYIFIFINFIILCQLVMREHGEQTERERETERERKRELTRNDRQARKGNRDGHVGTITQKPHRRNDLWN